MTVEIPAGNEAALSSSDKKEHEIPETAPQDQPKEKNPDANQRSSTRFPRVCIVVGVILALAAIAIVVALLPDWGNDSGANNTVGSQMTNDVPGDNNSSSSDNNNNTQSNNDSSNSNSSSQFSSETNSSNSDSGNNATPLFFESDNGPFHIKIPLLSSNITKPYTTVDEARHDIEQFAKYIVNVAINQRSHVGHGPVLAPGNEMFLESQAEDGAAGDSSRNEAFSGANDFETYQQESGVIRSDFVKSNGELIFAVLDDKILVWDLEGKLLNTVTMPPISLPEGGVDGPVPQPGLEVFDETEDEDVEPATSQSRSSVIWGWNPKPYISALMLNTQGNRLTAVVGGYGVEYGTGVDVIPVIQEYKSTRIIVYDIQDDGSLVEASQTDIDGYHANSYTVGDNVYVVTKTGLRTWEYLIQPLEPWMPEFEGMTDEEYKTAAVLKAEEIIPKFVDDVLGLYTADGQVVLSRLAIFAESIPSDDDISSNWFGPSFANSITAVNSFDMGQAGLTNTLSISSSATLQPGSWGYVYATTDWIWVADQGWRWVEDSSTYVYDTILFGFRLNGPSSSFSVYGTVPGSLLNQFSIDFYKDPDDGAEYVRAATTINFGWGFGWREEEDTVDQENASRTKNQVIIMKIPNSSNALTGEDRLEQLGSVELGKKDESITAVRFFDNISYVVTFERTDPFYVLDLSDPLNPKILGELEIPGFSEFMHPITDDNSVLVTIGRDANDDGVALGFKVSVFDSKDPTKPMLLDDYVVGQRWSGSSASWDERAFRYVRVGDLGRLIVPINIYAGYDDEGNQLGENFEGFYVFGVDISDDRDISKDIITKEFEIDHTGIVWKFTSVEEQQGCYCFSSLPERSMVFDGDLVTIKNQNVASTNLVSETLNWNYTFDNDMFCCGRDGGI